MGDDERKTVIPTSRGYQEEMLEESLHRNIVIAMGTGSGKTHIAILRMKHEVAKVQKRISWFFCPSVALAEQQCSVIRSCLACPVGLITGQLEPRQWKNKSLWEDIVKKYKIVVSTPQVLLDALTHGYIHLGRDISLLVFDEAHHARRDHPYNRIMIDFYFELPPRTPLTANGIADVRPSILGLTACPMFGGDVELNLATIERNLDCTIRSPTVHALELAKFVFTPIFKHIKFDHPPLSMPESQNLRRLRNAFLSLDIENDPLVKHLRKELDNLKDDDAIRRTDQRLSVAIAQGKTMTHRGLRETVAAAEDIQDDVGSWGADWFLWTVVQRALSSVTPAQRVHVGIYNTQKAYLLDILEPLQLIPVSNDAEDIEEETSPKFKALVASLVQEKEEIEAEGDEFSGIVFVERRDSVLVLAELIRQHPLTKDRFRVGILLGASSSFHRNTVLDITRKVSDQGSAETLASFRSGVINLLVVTQVAEEGIDIQACCCVIRWDLPTNMVSWAQSRGRARRQRSRYILFYDDRESHYKQVDKWTKDEEESRRHYSNPDRIINFDSEDGIIDDGILHEQERKLEFCVESTGAKINSLYAIPHLNNFCAILSRSQHANSKVIYELDPPEYPFQWHTLEEDERDIPDYEGPFGATIVLPMQIPKHLRKHTTDRIHPTKIAAFRTVAFDAYVSLYQAGLLDDNLLPFSSFSGPERTEEVKAMLAEVYSREGLSDVRGGQVDPWTLGDEESNYWWIMELSIDQIEGPITMITKVEPKLMMPEMSFLLDHPDQGVLNIKLSNVRHVQTEDIDFSAAKEYTRRILWCLYGSRMEWDRDNYAYYFLPLEVSDPNWSQVLSWYRSISSTKTISVPLEDITSQFGQDAPIYLLRDKKRLWTSFKFVRWQTVPLGEDQESFILECNPEIKSLDDQYPLLVVDTVRKPGDMLPQNAIYRGRKKIDNHPGGRCYLLRRHILVDIIKPDDVLLSSALPSLIRVLSMRMSTAVFADHMQTSICTDTDAARVLFRVPPEQLTVALTAPSASTINYEKLEYIGDTVLKFITSLRVFSKFEFWPEGYLTRRKMHVIGNAQLATEALRLKFFRFIMRDQFTPRRWRPKFRGEKLSTVTSSSWADMVEDEDLGLDELEEEDEHDGTSKMSTKLLADIIESLIGVSFGFDGFPAALDMIKALGVGAELGWMSISEMIKTVQDRTLEAEGIPAVFDSVETMIGYKFDRKMLLVEALTHPSCLTEMHTTSYERLEFIGDSVLDIAVVNYLFSAEGKNFEPGDFHNLKAACVNTHLLGYICLGAHIMTSHTMPKADARGKIEMIETQQPLYFWQCFQHSSPVVLDEINQTFARFQTHQETIKEALTSSEKYPWAALSSLEAPKYLGDIVESVLGAVYLDCGGDWSVVLGVLRKLGHFGVVERLVRDDVNVEQPVYGIYMWKDQHDKTLEILHSKRDNFLCVTIIIGGIQVAHQEIEERGVLSKAQVKFAAAEEALRNVKVIFADDIKNTPPDQDLPDETVDELDKLGI